MRPVTKLDWRMISGLALPLLVSAGCSSGPPLPDHTVDRQPLYDNNARVTVRVPSDISRAECEVLIDEYRSIAGPTGQVAVRKPSAKLEGQVLPWCVENQDKPGIFYNDDFF